MRSTYPVEDISIDVAAQVACSIFSRQKTLRSNKKKEMYRVLKPGGRLV
jgi:ubiquinone/menaquinone biosynthesis C-methylase UbiE